MTTLSNLFEVAYGNKFDMNKMSTTDDGGVAFIGRKGRNQGVSGYVNLLPNVQPFPAGLLTVALGGSSVLSTFVQQEPFYTAQNVAVLTPLDLNMSLNVRLYYAACIKHNDFRFTAFGREANRTLAMLELPDEVPRWATEAAAPAIEDVAAPAVLGSPIPLPNPVFWSTFRWDQLFDVTRGRYVPAAQKSHGSTPCVSSSAQANGVSRHINLAPNAPAGSITVARNGSIGAAFFHDEAYFATDDVHVLVSKGWQLTPLRGIFICTLIRLEAFRYSYGRKWSVEGMRSSQIRLPTNESGEVDWGVVDEFMGRLPFSAIPGGTSLDT